MTLPKRSQATILLVEDDATLAAMLQERLQARGYPTWRAETAAEAEVMADEIRPDVIFLDLMLPDGDGLLLCARLKERQATRIIVCSGTKRQDDAALAFKLGADDFIAKPFWGDELEARLEAALRRTPVEKTTPPSTKSVQRIGPLTIDQARCRVTLGSQEIRLTATEYRLLCALASYPNRVLWREELAEHVWSTYDEGIRLSLEVHLRRLRAKLKAGPTPAPALVAVRGFGYQLAWEPHEVATARA